jgi:hypothetical protein
LTDGKKTKKGKTITQYFKEKDASEEDTISKRCTQATFFIRSQMFHLKKKKLRKRFLQKGIFVILKTIFYVNIMGDTPLIFER